MSEEDEHRARMRRMKTSVDRRIAAAQQERGLLIVYTGAGKGKTTAALGMVVRCIGHGMHVAIVQFIKGALETAEEQTFKMCSNNVTFLRVGEGYTWETQDRSRDIVYAQRGWEQAQTFLADQRYHLVVLDELNIALHKRYIELPRVLTALKDRPPAQHVVITGRRAMPGLVEAADLVTEMRQVKHPFRYGIKAQAGVEF